MPRFRSVAELAGRIGQELAVTDWITVTQEQINQFADATGDHQWIHVDVQRARAGPFGAPIAHGFLTLSLIPRFFDLAIQFDEATMGVNYGLNKVRFMAPVPVGSRLRARLGLLASEPLSLPEAAALHMSWEVTIEREGQSKPVCIAQSLVRHFAAAA